MALQSQQKAPFARIGSRGSPLALAQAYEVRRRLAAAHQVDEAEISITILSTRGDLTQAANVPLRDIGGKGLFSKEIEAALLAGEIDIGVHSAKDMATMLPHGLVMPVFLPREDVRDAFISLIAPSLEALPGGARLGTSSLRRAAQMRRFRPDLQVVEFRGNVGTRLKKLEDGVADATLLAAAGLTRLGQLEHVTAFLDPRQFPPAPAQGAIGLEIREGDDVTFSQIIPLNDTDTSDAVRAERAFLKVLDGSCRTPIAAHSTLSAGNYSLYGQILSPDGSELFEAEIAGSVTDAEQIGTDLGRRLLDKAGPEFIAALKGV